MELVLILVGGLALTGLFAWLGRLLGGAFVAIFVVIMLIIAAILALSLFSATGESAGMGEALIFIFIWLPVTAIGLVGSTVGWISRKFDTKLHTAPNAQ